MKVAIPSKRLVMGIALLSISVAACTKPAPPVGGTKTVDWFVNHKSERVMLGNWCRDDSARWDLPNCQNAATAEQMAMWETKRTVADDLKFK